MRDFFKDVHLLLPQTFGKFRKSMPFGIPHRSTTQQTAAAQVKSFSCYMCTPVIPFLHRSPKPNNKISSKPTAAPVQLLLLCDL